MDVPNLNEFESVPVRYPARTIIAHPARDAKTKCRSSIQTKGRKEFAIPSLPLSFLMNGHIHMPGSTDLSVNQIKYQHHRHREKSKRTILEIMSRGGGPDGAAASSPPPPLESTSTFIMSLLSPEAMSASCAGGGWSSTSILLAGVGLLFWLRWFGNEKNDCLPFCRLGIPIQDAVFWHVAQGECDA